MGVMKPKWLTWVLLASFAAGALAGISIFSSRRSAELVDPTESTVHQAVARLGSLTVTVSGSGEMAPATTVELGFEQSGMLTELLVKAGDEVSAGELLARLRVDKTPAEFAAELAAAELAVIQAEQALDQLYENAPLETAQALLRVEQTAWALEEVQHDELERALAQQAVAEAQEAIDAGEMAKYIANSSASEDAIYTAYASLLFKEKLLAETEKQIARTQNQIKSAPNDMQKRMLKRQLMNLNLKIAEQRIDIQNAQARYGNMQKPAEALEVSLAETQLDSAQEQLASAQREWQAIQNGPTSGEIAAAQADYLEAKAVYARLKDGADPQQVAQLETALEIAQAQLADVQAEEPTLELVAPMDATVLQVDASAGDRISAGTFITLADLRQPSVEIYLDETDIHAVQPGDSAEIVFDALPDEVFSGVIALVDPSLLDTSNTSAGRVWAQLDATTPKSVMLPVGLNASVDIITGRVDESVLVPVEALRHDGSGVTRVYVLRDGTWEQIKVSVGLEDLTTAEILDGLVAGDIVAIGDMTSISGAGGIQ